MVQWIVLVLAIAYLKVILVLFYNKIKFLLFFGTVTDWTITLIFLVPPAYNVAAQRALLHRLGRAHSHEGVTSSISISQAPLGYYQQNNEDTGKLSFSSLLIIESYLCIKCHNFFFFIFPLDDDGAQVSAV